MRDLIDIMANILQCNNVNLNENTELRHLKINSLTFVQIVVAIEMKYNIEFDNEALLYEKYTNIGDIWEYILSKL